MAVARHSFSERDPSANAVPYSACIVNKTMQSSNIAISLCGECFSFLILDSSPVGGHRMNLFGYADKQTSRQEKPGISALGRIHHKIS
jgi:hypothetical protein